MQYKRYTKYAGLSRKQHNQVLKNSQRDVKKKVSLMSYISFYTIIAGITLLLAWIFK